MDNDKAFYVKGANIFHPEVRGCWENIDLFWHGNKFVQNDRFPAVCIDAENTWVMPGLIDCHMHICGESTLQNINNFRYDEPEETAIKRGECNAKLCIEAGVTTIRDMGNYERRGLTLRDYLKTTNHVGPRIFSCGNLITGLNGHGSDFGVQTSEKQLLHAVESELQANVALIKIINDPIYFSIKSLRQAVEMANKANKPLACHSYTKDSVIISTKSGVNSIEHAAGLVINANLTHSNHMHGFIVPTCVAASDVVFEPKKALSEMDDATLPIFQQWWKCLQENVPESIHRCLSIGVGTDSGFPPTTFGSSVWREMAILNSFGMSWKDCFIAATEINARILQQPLIGNLYEGSFADFVIFSSNPLKIGIKGKNNILSVFIDGKCVFGKHFIAPFV